MNFSTLQNSCLAHYMYKQSTWSCWDREGKYKNKYTLKKILDNPGDLKYGKQRDKAFILFNSHLNGIHYKDTSYHINKKYK